MDSFRNIGLNASGVRIGQYHPKAQLTDSEIELIRELYEKDGWKKETRPPRSFTGWTYSKLSKKFDVSEYTIRDIVKFNRRNIFASKFKKIRIKD